MTIAEGLRVTIVATGIDSKTSVIDAQTHSINNNIHENNLNQDNLKIQEVDTNSDSIIDDNDIPAFLRKKRLNDFALPKDNKKYS